MKCACTPLDVLFCAAGFACNNPVRPVTVYRKAKRPWSGRVQVECMGKDQMLPSQARDVARRMRENDRSRTVNAYHCTMCGHWHVGSSTNVRMHSLMHREQRRGADE